MGERFEITPIGYVRSALLERSGAPRQSWEGARPAIVEVQKEFLEALDGVESGVEVWILTWLHKSTRAGLKVRPRGEPANPIVGVFATRSPDRPNPIGLHKVRIMSIAGGTIEVDALEAIDGTPVVDIKPVIEF